MTTTTQASTKNATSNAPRGPEERRNFCPFNPVGVAALVAPKGRPRVRRRGAPRVQTGHVDVAHRARAQAGTDERVLLTIFFGVADAAGRRSFVYLGGSGVVVGGGGARKSVASWSTSARPSIILPA